MQVSLVFEDLADFVAAYRGKISVEGMLFDAPDLYPEGTILGVHISLSDELVLINGKAGVLAVKEKLTSSGATYLTLLRFVELDEDSTSLIERLTSRAQEEGAPVFSMDEAQRDFDTDAPPTEAIDFSTRQQSTDDVAAALSGALEHPADTQPADENEPPTRDRGDRRWLILALGLVAGLALIGVGFWILPGLLMPSMEESEPPPIIDEAFTAEPDLAETAATAPTASPATAGPGDAPEPTPVVPTPAPPIATATPVIQPRNLATRVSALDWAMRDEGVDVVITADGPVAPDQLHHFPIDDGDERRYVVQIASIESAPGRYRTTVEKGYLANIRTWHHTELTPPELHVVLDLALNGAVHGVKIEGSTVTISVGPSP